MKYTNEQIRGAILDTARLFEARPSLFDFDQCRVPDCGTPGCALGWIGAHLNIGVGTSISEVARILGHKDGAYFYDACREFSGTNGITHGISGSAANAVKILRAYADVHFPALSTPIVPEDRQLVPWSACAWKPNGARA